MNGVSLHQIRETMVRVSRSTSGLRLAVGTPPPWTAQVAAPAAAPHISGKERLARRLKRVPVLSNILLLVYRALKMPGRVLHIVHRLEMLDALHNRVAGVHEVGTALLRDVTSLHLKTDALAASLAALSLSTRERHEQLVRAVQAVQPVAAVDSSARAQLDGLAASADKIKQLVTDNAGHVIALHEKSDRYATMLRSHIEALHPVMHAGRDLVIGRSDGFIMAFPAEEWRLPAYQVMVGPLEPGLVMAMKTTIRAGMTVIDVGANVGTYTLLALRAVGASGKVVSYEPTPRTFAILKDNVQVNGFLETGRIDLRQKAVSDGSRATSQFFIVKDSLTHNSLYREAEVDAGNLEVVDVATVALDTDLGTERRIDVVKIDAEGAEPTILHGMRGIIKANPGIAIFIEFAPMHLARAGVTLTRYLDDIRRLGFEILAVDEPSGALRSISDQALAASFSVNLLLRRPRAV